MGRCGACLRPDIECLCSATCDYCGIRTNHTTAQHETAAQPTCVACHDVPVQDEDDYCPECLSERAEYYTPDITEEN